MESDSESSSRMSIWGRMVIGGLAALGAWAVGMAWASLTGLAEHAPEGLLVPFLGVALVTVLGGGVAGLAATVLGAILAFLTESSGPSNAGLGLFVAAGLITSLTAIWRDRRQARRFATLQSTMMARSAALQESEARFRSLAELSPDAILVVADGLLAYVNPAAARLLRANDASVLIGHSPFRWLEPEDHAAVRDWIRKVLVEDGLASRNPYSWRRMDGTRVESEVSVVQVFWDGMPAVQIIARDVTEENQIRQALQRKRDLNKAVIDTAPVVVLLLGTDGRILQFNPFLEKLTGVSLEEAQGQDWFETFLHREDRDEIRKIFQGCLNEVRVLGNVSSIRTRKGREVQIEWYDSPLRSPDGELLGLVCLGLDATKRLRAEAELRESERRWRDLAEALPQLVWTCTPDGLCNFLSRQWVEYTGKPESEQLGYAWLEQVHPDDRSHVWSAWGNAVASGEPLDVEFRIQRADGVYRWFKTRAVPLRGEDGRVVQWFGTNTDVEDLKAATEAMKLSEERLGLALAAGGFGIWEWDLTTDRVYWSDRCYMIAGMAHEEFRRHREHFRELLHPEDRSLFWKMISASLSPGGPDFEHEFRIVRPDGTIRWVMNRGQVERDETGCPIRMVGVVGDVTGRWEAAEALRESEARFRAVLDNTLALVYLVDTEGRFLLINHRWEEVFGLRNVQTIGRRVEDFFPKEVADHYLENNRQVLETGAPMECEEVASLEDGLHTFLSIKVPIARNEGEPPYAVCGISTDITDRKRAEDALRASEERLRLAVRASKIGLWDWDIRKNEVLFSPEWKAQLGYQNWEIGTGFGEWEHRVHPDDLQPILDRVHLSLQGSGDVHEVEFRMRHKNGDWRWIFSRAEVTRDEDGQAVRMIGCHVDVTKIRHAEREAVESRAKLKAALDSMSDAVFISDISGRFLEFNDAFVMFHRFKSRAELLPTLEDYEAILEVCTLDGEVVPMTMWAVPRALRGETVVDAEYRLRRRDTGQEWFGSYNFGPIRDAEGAVVGSVVACRDITDRKRAENLLKEREARLAAVLDSAADAIVTIDGRGVIESVNRAAEQLFGYKPEEMIGQNVSILMPSPYRENHDRYLANYLETGVARIIGMGREMLVQRKDGTVFPVDLTVSEIDHRLQFTGIIRDATRRKELEREVVEIASLEQRRIGQDLHDSVGQELTALNIHAGDLVDAVRTDPEGAERLAERMEQGLRRCQTNLRAVIRGLLPVPVDAEGLMAALADLADRTHDETGLQCAFDCPKPVSVLDNLTATHLYLIAQEAVHNAVKHAQCRSIRILLKANHGLVMQVEDDGVGVEAIPGPVQGMGLRIMQNRAAIIGAKLAVSGTSQGTQVTCELRGRSHG